jgi:hypothetical protein
MSTANDCGGALNCARRRCRRESSLGQSRRFDDVPVTSALPLITDLRRKDRHVRKPAQERKSAVFHCNTLSARERRQSCQPLVCYDQFKSRGGWIGKSPGHNATPRMLRDRNRSREKRLYGPDGRPSARVLIFRKRSGTISESARLVCGTDGGPLP